MVIGFPLAMVMWLRFNSGDDHNIPQIGAGFQKMMD